MLIAAMAAGTLIAPRTALPRSVRFTTGAVLISAIVFALLSAGVRLHRGLCGCCGPAGRGCANAGARSPRCRRCPGFHRVVLGIFTLLYGIYALAPEIQPDAIGYHLRLVSGYTQAQAFTNRLTFYEVLPHGLEMLFVPAFAIGGAGSCQTRPLCVPVCGDPASSEHCR